jgi:hypothetical protein
MLQQKAALAFHRLMLLLCSECLALLPRSAALEGSWLTDLSQDPQLDTSVQTLTTLLKQLLFICCRV